MAWRLKAKTFESCSCKMLCRCTLGPTEPDQGWCSAAIGIKVLEGDSDGVDLTGAQLVLHGQLPGDFLGGFDQAKLYLDSSLSDDQRRELDAIFHGEKGGVWAGLKEAIPTWLPSTVTKVEIEDKASARVTVEGAGQIVLEPLKTEDGKQATLNNAPIASSLGSDVLELAAATGSGFNDSEMRAWESLGYGATSNVEWSG